MTMDFISHILWAYVVFHKYKKVKLALLFAFLPDLLSWGLYLPYRVLKGIPFGAPDPTLVPDFIWIMYGVTHSVLVVTAVIAAVYFATKHAKKIFPLYILAGPFITIIDIPLHSREYLPTPFLWPISDWHFPGISWGTPGYFLLRLHSL